MSFMSVQAFAQVDKKDVRRGNRDFKKENYREAQIDYMKALVKDSLSVAANYNIANALYREGNFQEAQKALERIRDVAPASENAADYYFNLGDAAIQQQNWQAAVDAFRESLLRRPEDLMAKENYIYAKKKLEDQQQNQDQNQNNDQNQDQNNDQNQDHNNDQNQDNQNQDNQDQNDDKNDDQKDRNQDNQNNDQDDKDQQKPPQQQPQQGRQPKISPQAAQQMLQAIQAKEKETQDKVNKQKAEALKSRQKEKNW